MKLSHVDLPATKVQLAGIQKHECGYCHHVSGEEGSISYGFVSPSILATDYEILMLQGWRRSGGYFYKPQLHRTCCPAYTIRLPVERFQASKSQRKVLKRALHTLSKKKGDSDHSDPVKDEEVMMTTNREDEINIETEKASYSEEKFLLYQRYQVAIHNDQPEDITPKSFTRFLIESPLIDLRKEDLSASSGFQFGTYHQCYRLASTHKLLAVGVIDILPSGISSVYCFYDNDYRDLVLGKYTALKEIEFTKQHHFPYYYMGFYIHSCEKMRYKGDYRPSELLDCKTYRWISLTECVPILNKHQFSCFVTPFKEELDKLYEDSQPNESMLEAFIHQDPQFLPLEEVALDLGSKYGIVKFTALTSKFQEYFRPLLEEWIRIVGNDLAKKIHVMLY